MRCTPIEKLLPLYVEGDLAEDEASKVRAHLSSCDRCRGLEEEFRASQERLRTFAAPEFDDEFYEHIRGTVLTEINARPLARPSFFQTLRPLFFQRSAVAACLLFLVIFGALSGVLYHKLSNGSAYMVAVERGVRKIKPGQFTEVSNNPKGNAPISKVGERNFRPSSFTPRSIAQQKIRPGNEAGTRPEALTPQSSNAASATTAQAGTGSNGAASNTASTPEAVARMEIQTSDPNIRIIWLARKASE